MPRARTCIAHEVVCSDAFLDLPSSARALYPCLLFEADNDGALDSLKRTMRTYGGTEADLAALMDGGYLLRVDGVYFITDWWRNNKTDNRNYRPGTHQDQLSKLIVDANRRYVPKVGHQSDISLTSDANTKQYKEDELNAMKFNSSSPSNSVADYAAEEAANPPACRKCGTPLEPLPTGQWFCPQCQRASMGVA